jgi:hypothetical protein
MTARTHHPALWDGDESIVDALARHGLRDVFQLAVEGGVNEELQLSHFTRSERPILTRKRWSQFSYRPDRKIGPNARRRLSVPIAPVNLRGRPRQLRMQVDRIGVDQQSAAVGPWSPDVV